MTTLVNCLRGIGILAIVNVFPVSSKAQVDVNDSLALVALYNSTGGTNWSNNTNWLTGAVDTWDGITVSGGRVTQIDLNDDDNGADGDFFEGNNLSGTIPPELGNLTNLQNLRLSYNQLTGPIPPELGNLVNLQHLSLANNSLTGPIPPELGNLTNLIFLGLGQNQLTGPIPPELGNLVNLGSLGLGPNQLTGPIPPELGNLVNIFFLWFDHNQLTGPIPPELGNWVNLIGLQLQYNQLTGPIPPELGNWVNLQILWLNYNQLTGPIPPELGNLVNLQNLQLHYNQLTGPIPPELGNLVNLQNLLLHYNELTGPMPKVNVDTTINIVNNYFNFADIEINLGVAKNNIYTPQLAIPAIDTVYFVENSSVSIKIEVGGSSNNYQWYKDGVAIPGQTLDELVINSVSLSDDGIYALIISSNIITDLTLQTEEIRLIVNKAPAPPIDSLDNSNIIYSSLTYESSWDNGYSINTTQNSAYSFVPRNNYILYSVELPIVDISQNYPEPYTKDFIVAIYHDDDNKPGSLLTTVKGTAPFSWPEPLTTTTKLYFSSSTKVEVSKRYWISVFPSQLPADLGWQWNKLGVESLRYSSNPPIIGEESWISSGIDKECAYSLKGIIPPIAQNFTDSLGVGQALTLDIISEAKFDSDNILNTTITSVPQFGTYQINNDQSITYTADSALYGKEVLDYNLCNQFNLCDSATITIDVSNLPPVITLASVQLEPASKKELDISNYIYDPNGFGITTVEITYTSPNATSIEIDLDRKVLILDYSTSFFTGVDSFTMQVCDLSGDCSEKAIRVAVGELNKVFVYNAVSPNGDGLHDFLKILDLEFFAQNQVIVYDRRGNEEWSQEGYSNDDLTKAFIGVNSDGKDMLNGTYYYFISLISNSGNTYAQSGFFLLHR